MLKKIVFILLALVILVVVTTLSWRNSTPVNVDYVLGQIELPLAWLFFGAFVLGVLVALPFFALTGWGWKLRAKGLQKQVNELIKQRQREDIADEFKQRVET